MRKTEEEMKMRKKTAYQVLKDYGAIDTPLYDLIISAMQAYADQEKEAEAVGFGLWLLGNCDQSAICWYYEGEQMTTAQLYAIYLKNKF